MGELGPLDGRYYNFNGSSGFGLVGDKLDDHVLTILLVNLINNSYLYISYFS